jgi:hypothetical protein
MIEAKDHSRVSPEGKKVGLMMAKLADAECERLVAEGETDDRCKTCAFTAGTVPNGCLQTQSDALKAVIEDVPFMCHAHKNKHGVYDRICHGWYFVGRIARRREKHKGKLPEVPWDFSPPDEVKS